MSLLYEDFSIRIERGPGGGFRARAFTPAGEGTSELEISAPAPLLEPFEDLFRSIRGSRRSGQLRHCSTEEGSHFESLEDLGDRIFRSLFSGTVRQLLDQSCGTFRDRTKGLRIKLHFDPLDPEIASLCSLPWELLYRAETRDYLGFDRRTPVIRYLDLPRPTQALPFTPPLRVLLVASSPADHALLDLEKEQQLIEKAFAGCKDVQVGILRKASLEALYEELRLRPAHVLHFMGHGVFDEDRGEGCLLLETPSGTAEPINGQLLTHQLKSLLPSLVVLNACDSARTASSQGMDFFAGAASALVMGGAPAVVAMRAPITNRLATIFSKVFYRELATEQPVDAAVAEARLAMYRADPCSPEWATPVLFMRVLDGLLFQSEAHGQGKIDSPPAVNSSINFDYEQAKIADGEITNSITGSGGPASIALTGKILDVSNSKITNRIGK